MTIVADGIGEVNFAAQSAGGDEVRFDVTTAVEHIRLVNAIYKRRRVIFYAFRLYRWMRTKTAPPLNLYNKVVVFPSLPVSMGWQDSPAIVNQ